MARRIVNMIITLFFIFSFEGFVSASLPEGGQDSLLADKSESELYCGLALPVEGEQGEEGGEKDKTQEEPQDGSESEPDSGSQTDEQSS